MRLRLSFCTPAFVALFFLVMAWNIPASAQGRKELTFGVVGYSASLDNAATQFIEYLTKHTGHSIDPKPVMLSYENAVAFAAKDELDIALFTPITYIKAKKERESAGKSALVPIAISWMGGDRKTGALTYKGKVLYDPSELSADLQKKEGKPTVALIQGSASGFIFAIQALQPILGKLPNWNQITSKFDVWHSQKQSESLDLLFASKVNVAPVYEQELYTYLEECDKDGNVRQNAGKVDSLKRWLSRAAPKVAVSAESSTSELVDAVYECCSRMDTEEIPGDVIVVRQNPGLPNLVRDIRRAVRSLDEQLAALPDAPPYSPLQCSLRNRRMVGFFTDQDPEQDTIATRYENVETVYRKFANSEAPTSQQSYAARDLVNNIAYDIRYKTGENYKTKIAVVLAGGGASGAYEAGALSELLKVFADFRNTNKQAFTKGFTSEDFRIHLFVGTSAGAINAIAAALLQPKLTENPEGANRLKTVWSEINSDAVLIGDGAHRSDPWIVIGYKLVNRGQNVLLIGLFACIVYGFFRSLHVIAGILRKNSKIRTIATCVVFMLSLWTFYYEKGFGSVVLHLVVIAIAYMFFPGFSPVPDKRWTAPAFVCPLHSLFLIVPAAKEGLNGQLLIGAFLIVIDLLTIFHIAFPEFFPTLRHVFETRPAFRSVGVASRIGVLTLVFSVGPILLIDLLFNHEALFDPAPFEDAVVKAYSSLVDAKAGLDKPALGQRIMESLKQTKTELVITTSDFTRHKEGILPKELYFYRTEDDLPAIETIEDRKTAHWASLEENQSDLVNVVMASAAIFPGFPPRHMDGIRLRSADDRGPGEATSHDLVDGGFIHNVPVQAAVDLGSTHIIIIDVHPRDATSDGNNKKQFNPLGPNLIKAFDLLFDRAQSADIVALAKQRTFLLAPQERAIEVMDFDGHWDGFFGASRAFKTSYSVNQFLEDGAGDAAQGKGKDGQRVGFRQIELGELARQRLSRPKALVVEVNP